MIEKDSYLAQSVQSGNVFRVRGAIISIIQAKPGYARTPVREAVTYARQHGIDLFETQYDAERPIIRERAQWTKDYYAEALTRLQMNFTQERLEHVLDVHEALYPAAQTTQTNAARSPGGNTKNVGSRPSAAAIAVSILILLLAILILMLILFKK